MRAFKEALERSLPGAAIKVVLFGSRARGDARPDSDSDVAVLLENEAHASARIRATISDEAFQQMMDGYAFAPVVLPGDYLQPVDGRFRSELARRIAREGIVIP